MWTRKKSKIMLGHRFDLIRKLFCKHTRKMKVRLSSSRPPGVKEGGKMPRDPGNEIALKFQLVVSSASYYMFDLHFPANNTEIDRINKVLFLGVILGKRYL